MQAPLQIKIYYERILLQSVSNQVAQGKMSVLQVITLTFVWWAVHLKNKKK
jgi:hypothetical protein